MKAFSCCLEADGLTSQATGARAHLPVSFRVGPKEVVWLSGPSGSGKTSILSALLGLRAPLTERVHRYVDDVPIALSDPAISAWRGRYVGVVPQGAGLIASLTADDHLQLFGLDAKAREHWLTAMNLWPQKDARADTLSGGEARRLCVARSLGSQSPVLLWDEPTAGLDEQALGIVWRALITAAENGAAVVVASHDTHGLHMLQAASSIRCETVSVSPGVRPSA